MDPRQNDKKARSTTLLVRSVGKGARVKFLRPTREDAGQAEK